MAQPLARSETARRLVLSMPEIAELANVQRPVVTTWRRRYTDFPSPATRESQPVFDAHEICDWLVTTNRAERAEVEIDLHLHTVTTLASAMPAADLVGVVTALICLRHLDDEELADEPASRLVERAYAADPTDEFVVSELRAVSVAAEWLPAAVDDLVEAAWGCSGAFERIMSARGRLGLAHLTRDVVAPELARLIAGLSGAKERVDQGRRVLVADPAAGPGDLLAAIAQLIGPDLPPAIVAAEPDRFLARLVRRRLAVHGVDATDLDVRIASELGEPSASPDAVVAQLPYQPQETRSAMETLAALDEIALNLAPGRTAVVLGPAEVLTGALRAYSPAERVRAEILSSGVVEAVIRLPGGLLPTRPGYETAVWVMTAPDSSRLRNRMLVADVSDQPLTGAVDALVSDVVTWRADGYRVGAHTPTYCTQQGIREVVESKRALTAQSVPTLREIKEVVPATVAHVAELENALDTLADPGAKPRPAIRTGLAATTVMRHPTTTIGSLLRSRRLTLIKGSRLAAADVNASGAHPVLGRAELCRRAPVGARAMDRAVLADRYPRTVLTEPGDVVVTTIPQLGVYLDRGGFKVVEFPARALRIPASERATLTPRVLAALLSSGRDGKRAPGAIRVPRRLEDWSVPLLGAALTARLDQLLERLDDRRRHAQEEIDLLDQLSSITIAGLTDGTLTVQP